MGWNTLTIRTGSKLFDGIDDGSWLYFVHSYAPVPDDEAVIAATTEYGGTVVAAVEQGRVWATQFHPEKSAANGLRLLQNFADACG
jgi:imidazole glycerol-phosphate synthase subunit HisH